MVVQAGPWLATIKLTGTTPRSMNISRNPRLQLDRLIKASGSAGILGTSCLPMAKRQIHKTGHIGQTETGRDL